MKFTLKNKNINHLITPGDIILTENRTKLIVVIVGEKLTVLEPLMCNFKQYCTIEQLKEEYKSFKLIPFSEMEGVNYEYSC